MQKLIDRIPPNAKKYAGWAAGAVAALLLAISTYLGGTSNLEVAKLKATITVAAGKLTSTAAAPTVTIAPSLTLAPTVTLAPSVTPPPPSSTLMEPSPTAPIQTETVVPFPASPTPGATIMPYYGAPACTGQGEEHDVTLHHTVWDYELGCHYDHEHGDDMFTEEVAEVFAPLGDMRTLQGGLEVGHTNPSSPAEFTLKGGGMKAFVHVPVAHPGAIGFEGATIGICDVVSQIHGFGNYAIELETRFHTANVFVHQCMGDEHGFIYTAQGQEYGQRVVPYQGDPLPYPDNFLPTWLGGLGPYISIDCDDDTEPVDPRCASDSAVSKWTSKRTGPASSPRPPGSSLLQVLWDVFTYQSFDWNDQVYPFTWIYECSSDGGATYDPAGCWQNNSASELHEIAGTIPASWDNAAGFDTDPDTCTTPATVGCITGEAFVTVYGTLLGFCPPNIQCYPIKLVNAFVGKWGADLCPVKCSRITFENTNPRDVFFDEAGELVEWDTPGAIPSGWIGPNN